MYTNDNKSASLSTNIENMVVKNLTTGIYYGSLQDAFSSVNSSNKLEKLQILKDIQVSTALKIDVNKNIELYTSSESGEFNLSSDSTSSYVVENSGTLKILGKGVISNSGFSAIKNDGDLSIDMTLISDDKPNILAKNSITSYAINNSNTNSNLSILGGYIKSGIGIYNYGTLNMSGGIVESTVDDAISIKSGYVTLIDNATIKGMSGIYYYGSSKSDILTLGKNDGNVVVDNPLISVEGAAVGMSMNLTFNYYDGTLKGGKIYSEATEAFGNPNLPDGYSLYSERVDEYEIITLGKGKKLSETDIDIGDFVTYTPDSGEYTAYSKYSGYTEDQIFNLKTQMSYYQVVYKDEQCIKIVPCDPFVVIFGCARGAAKGDEIMEGVLSLYKSDIVTSVTTFDGDIDIGTDVVANNLFKLLSVKNSVMYNRYILFECMEAGYDEDEDKDPIGVKWNFSGKVGSGYYLINHTIKSPSTPNAPQVIMWCSGRKVYSQNSNRDSYFNGYNAIAFSFTTFEPKIYRCNLYSSYFDYNELDFDTTQLAPNRNGCFSICKNILVPIIEIPLSTNAIGTGESTSDPYKLQKKLQ